MRNSTYRAHVRSGHIEHGDTEISYQSSGEGPAVLYIHAGVADSRMWKHQMEIEGHQNIAFDQRGFGKTEWAAGPFADRHDALAVLDHLQVERSVIVGCSSGGEAALQLAIVAPQRVDGLVLVATSARGWEPSGGWSDEAIWEEAEAASEAGDVERVVELDAELWLAGPDRSIEDIDPDLVELFKDMDRKPVETESARSKHVETGSIQTNDRLDEIHAPTLVVVGMHEWPDLKESAQYLAEELSDGDAVVIDGAAHLPSLEQPERFNTALEGFLRSF